jgi:non-canonical purine NTP pyrophosphatase (RdgB/HAM1 family)
MPGILFATHNAWKARLFEPSFRAYGFTMKTLDDLASDGKKSSETGKNAVENALVKARSCHSSAHAWVFGDDAGLEIDALSGEPGLQARRWNGIFPEDVDDQTWLDYLLDRMRDIPAGKRTAAFVSGWALITPNGKEYVHAVRSPFQITECPVRQISPGSPVSAVRLGAQDDLEHRQGEIFKEWQRWGIFEQLGFFSDLCGFTKLDADQRR